MTQPPRPPRIVVGLDGSEASDRALDASVGADLLVLGARGAGGFLGLLLGSVAQQCVTHARCPVALIR